MFQSPRLGSLLVSQVMDRATLELRVESLVTPLRNTARRTVVQQD
jgi:hypothetical protein